MIEPLVFIDEYVAGIRWDSKYATSDNFTGAPVDGYQVNRIAGTRALCDALEAANARAGALGFGLLVWDGYRPQRATEAFVRWSQQAEDGLTKQRHYPNIDRTDFFDDGFVLAKSAHSRGSTVDLTLVALDTGAPLAMGGDHDLMDPVSHHAATGITTQEQANRRSLRAVMELSGFTPYETEWWHYTLTDEPFPGTYFDEPIA
jgi:D-alanyl-D-alanine dipeptidase